MDLTSVAFLGSAAISELVAIHDRAADQNTPLRIVDTTPPVLRPFQVLGVSTLLTIHPDLTTALSTNDHRQPLHTAS